MHSHSLSISYDIQREQRPKNECILSLFVNKMAFWPVHKVTNAYKCVLLQTSKFYLYRFCDVLRSDCLKVYSCYSSWKHINPYAHHNYCF